MSAIASKYRLYTSYSALLSYTFYNVSGQLITPASQSGAAINGYMGLVWDSYLELTLNPADEILFANVITEGNHRYVLCREDGGNYRTIIDEVLFNQDQQLANVITPPQIDQLDHWIPSSPSGIRTWTYQAIIPPEVIPTMTMNVIQLKRRLTGDVGPPTALVNGELAVNEVSKVLYYGLGADNDGNALSIIPIGGEGAYVGIAGNQTVAGIKTFSGELHLALPILPTQAANKSYVDTAVSQVVAEAITGAFHYVGILDATTNSLPAVKVQGDLYRVTHEGNFAGTTPFVASADDFVVWNGTAWDKIDNTDPTLSGTTDRITVVRTGENSYSVDLAATYQGGSQLTRLGTITEGVWNASIIALNYGGTGADLSNAADGTLFKKMGAAFVPAIVGIDFVKTNFGIVNGGTF